MVWIRTLCIHRSTVSVARVAALSEMLADHLGEEMGRVCSPTIVVIPVPRDELIPSLVEGRGDIVMANLTITPEREKLVDFTPPLLTNIAELVATGPETGPVESFDDLVEIGMYRAVSGEPAS